MINRFKAATFIIILSCTFLASAGQATAYKIEKHEDEITGMFVVSPTKYDVEVEPGQSVTRDVVLSNRTGEPMEIIFTIQDFKGSSDPSQPTVFLEGLENRFGARLWLKPELDKIVLQHGETLTMPVTITVPETADSGGHYAALFASMDAQADHDGSIVNVTNRVGCLFLVRVPGAIVETGSIRLPEVPAFAEFGPVDIGIVFNNQGNIHVIPVGRVIIENFLGETVAEIPLSEWVVLPDASSRNMATWDTRYGFGRYTAKAEVWYGGERKELLASSTFWVVPWRLMLVFIVGATLMTTVGLRIVNWRRSIRMDLESEIERLKRKAGED